MMKLDKNKIKTIPQNELSEVAKLQENIDRQLQEIRKENACIIRKNDVFRISEILNATNLLINDCHDSSQFITNKYERFSLLCHEYQRLLLRYESYQIKVNLENERKKLQENIDSANTQVAQTCQQINELKDEQKSIITTILGIVLAISIIPTAIVGIEKVHPNYILPFISTIALFGMIMIAFIYSIYQSTIKLSTFFILLLFILLTGLLWFSSWNINISAMPRHSIDNVVNELTIEARLS